VAYSGEKERNSFHQGPLVPGVKLQNFTSRPTTHALKVHRELDRYLAVKSLSAGSHSNGRFGGAALRMPVKVETREDSVFDRFYYTARSGSLVIDAMTNCMIKDLLSPGSIRTGYGSLSVFRSQSTSVKKLSRGAWPTVAGRSAWPSSPTIVEWLEMVRRGAKSSSDLWVPSGKTALVTRREYNENIELARRIIVRQVVGLRADVEIERRFLRYFQYRWGFLILIHTKLPAGLVRKLTAIWLADPYSLWLERRVSLRTFLRQVPLSVLNRSAAKIAPEAVSDYSETEHRAFTKPADWYAESYSAHSSELD